MDLAGPSLQPASSKQAASYKPDWPLRGLPDTKRPTDILPQG